MHKITKILAIIMAVMLVLSLPFTGLAASKSYKSGSSVKIACSSSKKYDYSTSNSYGFTMSGTVEIKKGGVASADKVILKQTPYPGYGTRTLSIEITMSNGTKKTLKKTIEKSGSKTKITTVENGKKTTTTKVGLYTYNAVETITVSGTLWKAIKSVTVVTKQTGVPGGDLSLTFKS